MLQLYKVFLTFSSELVYLGVLNAIVFGMDKETLSRLNWSHMKVPMNVVPRSTMHTNGEQRINSEAV